ncbi:hypothetical protein Y5W_02936 [Alcanivorax sp. 521-1]|uniref:MoaF-like domain-containing protein n=1 Tax=Alloalcanivorax profundimaris TaxID=2735259 RepID=A0ABS0AU34_9GAMM|nr:YdeI/OmpD-associated family protein [Alloalcanivorax profundimaris]MBF5057642.1 hypothetical protein [Alloalcanivorax profundimaris]
MAKNDKTARFSALLRRPKKPGDGEAWLFVVLPKDASALLPRRGRTSVDGALNGAPFAALMLEPDGNKSHWMRIDSSLLNAAHAAPGDVVELEIRPVAQEPEPDVPADLREALRGSPRSQATWDATTTLARVDWVHWVVSAKQAKTRAKRINDACDKLAAGEKRVCCFDPSGFYSKALSAPESTDQPLTRGLVLDIRFPRFTPRLTFLSERSLSLRILDGDNQGFTDTVDYEAVPLRDGLVMLSWQENIGTTVVHVLDFTADTAHTVVTPEKGGFLRLTGEIEVIAGRTSAAP